MGALLLLPANPPVKSAMPGVTADAMAVSGERGRLMAAVTVAEPARDTLSPAMTLADAIAADRYFRPHPACGGGHGTEVRR